MANIYLYSEPLQFESELNVNILKPLSPQKNNTGIVSNTITTELAKTLEIQILKTDKPIKGVPLCYRVSLNQKEDNILKYVQKADIEYNIQVVELYNNPLQSNVYEDYEMKVLYILDSLNSLGYKNISLFSDIYISNIISNISKYKNKIRYLSLPIYGDCANKNPTLENLLTYSIYDAELLQKNILLLKENNIELSIEINSVCKNVSNISNTFASVLWITDFLFKISMAGITNTYIQINDTNNIYAYLAFSKVAKDCTFFTTDNRSSTIPVYITKNNSEGYYITVIHKSFSNNNLKINIYLDLNIEANLTRLLTNQRVEDTEGIVFGSKMLIKSTIQNVNVNYNKIIVPEHKKYSFIVDKFSVTILDIPFNYKRQKGGAYFTTINNSDEHNTMVTIQPNDKYDNVPITMFLPKFKKEYQENM